MRVKSISCRRILNSHGDFTGEYSVELDDGRIGAGAAPQGETLSIYEHERVAIDPGTIIESMRRDRVFDVPLTQETFDEYLEQHIPLIGRNNAFALSLAFFNARKEVESIFRLFERGESPLTAPALCLNILNGGWHAYTNPVLSDFSEYLLVSRSNDIERTIRDHGAIQRTVRERLINLERLVVKGNSVHRFRTLDNRECVEFLLDIRDSLGLRDAYDLMIDASGGDLRDGDGYRLPLTDTKLRSAEEFYEYWADLIHEYGIGFLEDPFHETDFGNWTRLTTTQSQCKVIGDNLYSSDAARIEEGAWQRLSHGAVIKPNQSGTVSAVKRAIEAVQRHNMIAIASHRSISTESIFLPLLTCIFDVKYIKIGPLLTDYSSIIRLNEILRLTEKWRAYEYVHPYDSACENDIR
jgi:enolase